MITVDGKDKRIGLALSGGGFRAAAFHLGVFRKLEEMKFLDKIDVLSCVSGGSIAGAFLAAEWRKADALDRLEKYLRTRSIAVSTFVGGLLDPFHSRLDKLADSYDRDLFHKKTLADLAGGPRLYICTTNLATGNLFFFVTGGDKDAEMGEHELGVVSAPDFSLARAVAASSAFPPVFPPLKLTVDAYAAKGVEYVTLTDGGVYDNLGVNPLLRSRNELDYIIVSDGGKPFPIDGGPTKLGTGVLIAAIPILMEQVRGLQFTRMLALHQAGKGPKPLWFSIDSKEGEAHPGDAELASAIGTNLKALSAGEMALLGRQGGALFGERIRVHAPQLSTV